MESENPDYPDAVYKQHYGGEQPEEDRAMIKPEYRGPSRYDGIRISCSMAARFDWGHDGGDDDIVGYWVLFDPSQA